MANDKVKEALNERFLLQKEYLGDAKPVNLIQPLVSVTVATYQHVNYIKECLDGILMQEVTFPYEIILGEDGSVDGTQEICKEYAEKYPDKIRLFIRDRKLSQYVGEDGKVTRFNGIWNRMSARGKYIAWCEGDDYWIDPLKLQKQVDFLENNPDFGLVHTLANLYDQKLNCYAKRNLGGDFIVDDLFVANRIVTLTTCFRKKIYLDYVHDMYPQSSWLMGDYPLWLYICLHSRIHFIDSVTGVYRVLAESASHSRNMQKNIDFYLSTYSISCHFAIKYKKGYLLNSIKRQLLYHIIYVHVMNDKRVCFDVCKDFCVFRLMTVRMLILCMLSYVGCGRKLLKKRWS